MSTDNVIRWFIYGCLAVSPLLNLAMRVEAYKKPGEK